MSDRAKKRAPARKFTTLDDHEALDHARWSYARMKHLAKLVLNGETEEAVKMARALTGKDKATAHAMVKIEQGEMVLRDSGWVLRFLVENMGEALTNSGAENYLTMSFRLGVGRDSYAKDLYSVTLQREGKLTPHEARMLAEKERDAALAEVAKLRAKLAAAAAEIRALLLPTAPALTHAEALASARVWCDERANATAASDPHCEIARLAAMLTEAEEHASSEAMRADGVARAWRRALDPICEDCMRHRSVCICGPLEQEAPLG